MNYNYKLYNELKQQIADTIYETGDKDKWYAFLRMQEKKAGEGYVSATYYANMYLDTIEGAVLREAYLLYTKWCDTKRLPFLTPSKFNKYMRDEYSLFIKHKWINKKYCRVYVKLDHCPTCDRRF